MKSVSFTVYGEPISKLRARTTKKGITYIPDKTERAEFSFQAQAIQWKPETPFDGPLYLRVIFYRDIPKSFSKKKRALAETKKIFPITKPDVDNLTKLVMDAMQFIFYHNDSQVVHKISRKFYSITPRIEVKLMIIE